MDVSLDILLNQLVYESRPRVKQDVLNVLKQYNALEPRCGDFIHNDGSASECLYLHGTIPMTYESVKYNAPVDVFLLNRYPIVGPIIYVRPTVNMIIKPSHHNVDSNGLVSIPYLNAWNNSSSLSAVLSQISDAFGRDPPLFARPSSNTMINNTSYNSNNGSSHNSTYRSSVTLQGRPVVVSASKPIPAVSSSQQQYTHGNRNAPSPSVYNPSVEKPPKPSGYNTSSNSEVTYGTATATTSSSLHADANATLRSSNSSSSGSLSKDRLIAEVTSKMQLECSAYLQIMQQSIGLELNQVDHIKACKDVICKNISDMKQGKLDLENAIKSIDVKHNELIEWKSKKDVEVVDIESSIVSYDLVSAQLVQLHAEEKAIEDAMEFLKTAYSRKHKFGGNSLDLDSFLRETRGLSEQLFLKIRHIKRINKIINQSV